MALLSNILCRSDRDAVLTAAAGTSFESVRNSCAGLVLRRSGGSPRRARPSLLRPSFGSPDAAAPWAGRGTGLGGFAPKPPGFIALRARAASFPGTDLRSVRKGCPGPQGGKSQGVWGTGPPAAAATARGPQEFRTLSIVCRQMIGRWLSNSWIGAFAGASVESSGCGSFQDCLIPLPKSLKECHRLAQDANR